MNSKPIVHSVGLVDDHILMRKGLSELISNFENFEVTLEASNGKDLIEKLVTQKIPEILLIDIHMKEMDGFQTAEWVALHHPETKFVALSMYNNEGAILKMLKAGAKGYLLKDMEPAELLQALNDVAEKGYYHTDLTGNVMYNMLRPNFESKHFVTERELEFLKLASSDLTYKEIADQMCLAPRTIDGFREDLFVKFSVKSRVGLVLVAIRSGIISL